jgi:hypothetical protein
VLPRSWGKGSSLLNNFEIKNRRQTSYGRRINMRHFADVYAQHHAWLKSWPRKKFEDSDTAAELAQDTFVRVLTQAAHNGLHEFRKINVACGSHAY